MQLDDLNVLAAFLAVALALGDVASVLDEIAGLRERPAGRARLVVSPTSGSVGSDRHAAPGGQVDGFR